MAKKRKEETQKKPTKPRDERKFDEAMRIAEIVMRENRELLRKLAKS